MTNENKGLVLPFIAVTTLFFAWGFITQMVDPLIASVKTVFSLTNTESMLTQFAYFMAYGVVSLPAAAPDRACRLQPSRSSSPLSR